MRRREKKRWIIALCVNMVIIVILLALSARNVLIDKYSGVIVDSSGTTTNMFKLISVDIDNKLGNYDKYVEPTLTLARNNIGDNMQNYTMSFLNTSNGVQLYGQIRVSESTAHGVLHVVHNNRPYSANQDAYTFYRFASNGIVTTYINCGQQWYKIESVGNHVALDVDQLLDTWNSKSVTTLPMYNDSGHVCLQEMSKPNNLTFSYAILPYACEIVMNGSDYASIHGGADDEFVKMVQSSNGVAARYEFLHFGGVGVVIPDEVIDQAIEIESISVVFCDVFA